MNSSKPGILEESLKRDLEDIYLREDPSLREKINRRLRILSETHGSEKVRNALKGFYKRITRSELYVMHLIEKLLE